MSFFFPTLNDQFWIILLNGAIILKGSFCLRHQNATKLPHFLTLFYSSRLEKKWSETKNMCNYGDFGLLLALRVTLKMLFFKYRWKTMSVWIRSDPTSGFCTTTVLSLQWGTQNWTRVKTGTPGKPHSAWLPSLCLPNLMSTVKPVYFPSFKIQWFQDLTSEHFDPS